MPTLLEISNNLAKVFVESRNKKLAIKRIAHQINYLQFVTNKQLIDYELKITIVQVIDEFIRGERAIQLPGNQLLPVKPKDVSSFSRLRGRLLEMIWIKGQQEKEHSRVEAKKQNVSLQTLTVGVRNVTYAAYSEIEKYFKIKK